MMNRKWKTTCIIATAAIWLGTAGPVLADKNGEGSIQPGSITVERQESRLEYPNLATITPQEALQIAVDETEGKVLKLDLERRQGFLVYDVKAVTPYNSIMKVTVDAGTGTVLDLTERSEADIRNKEHGDDRKSHHGEKRHQGKYTDAEQE
jgi:hypothetical protein